MGAPGRGLRVSIGSYTGTYDPPANDVEAFRRAQIVQPYHLCCHRSSGPAHSGTDESLAAERQRAGAVSRFEVGDETLFDRVRIGAEARDLSRHARSKSEMISEPAGRWRL